MGILKKIQDTVATVKEERKQRRKEIEQQREMLERKERHRIATERALESLRPLNEKLLNLDYKKATPEDVLGLLGRGADVDALERRRAGNWSEITPVALALKAFNYPVFEALVHHGANLSILMVDYEYDDGPGSIFRWAHGQDLFGIDRDDNWRPPYGPEVKERAGFYKWFKENFKFMQQLGRTREEEMRESYTVTQRNFLGEPMSYTYAARGKFFPKVGIQGYVLPDKTVIELDATNYDTVIPQDIIERSKMKDTQLQEISPKMSHSGKKGKGKSPVIPPIKGGSVYGG